MTPSLQILHIGNHISAQIVSNHGLDTELIDLLQLAKSPDTTSAILSICRVIELLAHLNHIVMPLYIKTLNNHERTNDNPLVNDILTYINLHFKEDIHITDIAEQFNIDPSYLAHLFKEHVGMSLWNYVILRRLHLFNDLIRNSHYSNHSITSFPSYLVEGSFPAHTVLSLKTSDELPDLSVNATLCPPQILPL